MLSNRFYTSDIVVSFIVYCSTLLYDKAFILVLEPATTKNFMFFTRPCPAPSPPSLRFALCTGTTGIEFAYEETLCSYNEVTCLNLLLYDHPIE